MSVGTILETVLIGPLKLTFEIIFDYANRFTHHPGFAIIVLSLAVNFLVLPLYRRADAMQEESRETEARLRKGVDHIKKTFSGDERMMILQTYYRQNHYRPTDSLKGSVSLLLEIPFFIAAYQFLSGLRLLEGVSFGLIRDLSAPDGLLAIGEWRINVLPILMTAINVISSAIYLRGFPRKTKVQLYVMAGLFLVLLYPSPSGLVLYWTVNNLFSLGKNLCLKLKHPKRFLAVLAGGALVGIAVAVVPRFSKYGLSKKIFLVGIAVFAAILPSVVRSPFFKKYISGTKPNPRLFFVGALFMTVLVGIFIPSVYISASTQEFVNVKAYYNPMWYVVESGCMAAGTFLIWMQVFYGLASPGGKAVFEKLVLMACAVMLVDYMFFGDDLGNLSATLQFTDGFVFSVREQLVNLLTVAAVAAVMLVVICKWKRVVAGALVTAILALTVLSGRNLAVIHDDMKDVISLIERNEGGPHFKLSRTGKNVIVILLDRAAGYLVPYIFSEKPELQEQFSGFTYYKNTVSFGWHTNISAPSLLGGYEYTPVEMNRRRDELLMDKHNEALLLMPVLFSQNGAKVTVCDPVYANYKWISDLSVFDDYPGISAYVTEGWFNDSGQAARNVENTRRNFFCFDVMKTLPLVLQGTVYNWGVYHQADFYATAAESTYQVISGRSTAVGLNSIFMDNYLTLANLSQLMRITGDDEDTFLFMYNSTTHEPGLLSEPAYEPAEAVDNTAYDAEHPTRTDWDGNVLAMEDRVVITHYHVNMAAFLQLGKWLDALRESGVYDNTRIILTSDHGYPLFLGREVRDDGTQKTPETYFPLLMVKDFDSTGFTVSPDFMTLADIPTLAMDGVIRDPVNPFTGKAVNSDEKFAHDQFLTQSDYTMIDPKLYTFPASGWIRISNRVTGNIWDPANWTYYNEPLMVLDHNEIP